MQLPSRHRERGKEKQHKRRALGWHDYSAKSKSKKATGPNYESLVKRAHSQRSDMRTGYIHNRCTRHKGERNTGLKISLFRKNLLGTLGAPSENHVASRQRAAIWRCAAKRPLAELSPACLRSFSNNRINLSNVMKRSVPGRS